MTTVRNKKCVRLGALVFSGAIFFFLLLNTSYAQALPPFKPLVGIPGFSNSNASSLPDYINKVYILIITIGALFGVVKIAIAGVKYATTDVVTGKSSAREDIKNVLLGLAILLLPFVVLSTINPNLTRLDVLKEAPKINLNQSINTTNTSRPGINTGEGQTSAEMADEAIQNATNIAVRTGRYTYSPIFDPNCPTCVIGYDDTQARDRCHEQGGILTPVDDDTGECTYGEIQGSGGIGVY